MEIMKQIDFCKWTKLISFVIVVSILLASCGAAPTQPPPPIIVTSNPVSGPTTPRTYVNILINSVQFTGPVSNIGNEGNLQLFTVVSDDSGHADALNCPYGGSMLVHQGDLVKPCKAGLTYPEDQLQEHLYVMLIAVDMKDDSVVSDIGFNGLSAALGSGFELAIKRFVLSAAAASSPEAVVGFIALNTLLGFLGNKAQQYFQKNYVIGSQSFLLSRASNWNNGQEVAAASTNNQVDFIFSVQKSTTVEGQIVDAAPAIPDAQALVAVVDTPEPASQNPTPLPILGKPCPDAPPTRIAVGDMVLVTTTDGDPLILRSSPAALGNNWVLKINKGIRLRVLDGPTCANNFVYWRVNMVDGMSSGWVAEGDSSLYYLAPVY